MKSFSIPVLFLSVIFFPEISNAQYFTEYQDSANIDHIFKQTGFLGGGAVFFDYDNDGDDDLYITSGNERDAFYENNGDGTFAYKSIDAGFLLTKLYYTTGVIAGDIDNDGYKDLFVTTWFSDFANPDRNLLYHNNGDGTFTEIWNHQEDKDKAQTMGATFIDFDLDGLLDIYAVNYVDETGFIFDDDNNIIGFDHTCYANTFYHNLGNGEFQEIGDIVHLDDTGCALAVTATDFDLDGDMDIYLANDFGEFILGNRLFENNLANLYFDEVSFSHNVNAKMYGMGIAVGDVDNDLDLDYYVTNFGKNVLFRNDGDTFANITDLSGTGDQFVSDSDSLMAIGWGTVLLDIDNDSDLDLYVGNGYVPSPSFLPSQLFQNDKLFLNDGNAVFSDTGTDYGIENQYATRGVTYSDFDNDGDLDILAVVENIPNTGYPWATLLYRNQNGNQKNWFQATLEGVTVNRDAFGSKVYLFAAGQTFLQEVSGGSSHGSQTSSRIHFGLGDIDHIDSLQVVWTGGERQQTLYDLNVNQHIHITEDTALINSVFDIPHTEQGVSVLPNPADQFINIETPNLPAKKDWKIKLFDTYGKTIKEVTASRVLPKVQINISDLTPGVYFISVNIGGEISSEKVLVYH